MDNIILIGFMGVGKTEVGKLLAKKLKMTYIDTDEMIEKQQGISINEIFEHDGEEKFRDLESAILDRISGLKGHVISTGGGMVLRPANIVKLKKLGKVVLLWSVPDVIYNRLKNSGNRPLLKVADPKARIVEILEFRTPIYKNIADFEVDTSLMPPESACDSIIRFVERVK